MGRAIGKRNSQLMSISIILLLSAGLLASKVSSTEELPEHSRTSEPALRKAQGLTDTEKELQILEAHPDAETAQAIVRDLRTKIKTDPIFIVRCREFNIELITELEIDSRISYSG